MNRFAIQACAIMAVGLFAIPALAGAEDITLKRKPAVGDVSEFKLTAVFQTEQGEVNFSQKRTEKVTEVKPTGGFVQTVTTSDTKISFGGQELPNTSEASGTSEIGPDGLVISIISQPASDASSYRIANLHSFKIPDSAMKAGDEIKFDIPADSKKGTPAVKSVYTVVGKEKVKDWDCVKFTFTSQETEGDPKSSVKGTVWLSSSDGSLVKAEEEWKDVQPAGAPFPVSGKYSTERTK